MKKINEKTYVTVTFWALNDDMGYRNSITVTHTDLDHLPKPLTKNGIRLLYHRTGTYESATKTLQNVKNNIIVDFKDNILHMDKNISVGKSEVILTADTFENVIKWVENLKKSGVPEAIFEPYEPVIIRRGGKHDNAYYIVNNPDELGELALSILIENKNNNEYSWMDDYTPTLFNNETIPTYTKEDIAVLPESMESEKEVMLDKLLSWERKLNEMEVIKNDYNDLLRAISEKNGKLAISFLTEYNSNREYREFDIIKPSKINS